ATRLPYNGQDQELSYKVIGENEEVVHTGKAVFTKKDLLGRPVNYTPKEIGNHNFKVTFEGNEKYNSASIEGTLEIYDNRKEVTIEFTDTQKVYNGEVQKPQANVLNEQGQIVGKAEVTYDFKPEHILAPAGKGVGTYAVTAKFKGDSEYSYTEAKGTMEITKCKPKVSVASKTAKYTGSAIKTGVSINPNCGYINLYTGVNTKLIPTVYVDVNLGDDLIGKLISDLINSMDIKTAADLKKMFENEELIKLLESAGINISDITNALDYLPDNLNISFGAPVNAGAYVSTVIVLDKNANVAVGIGGLAIDKAKKNVVFTEESLSSDSNIKPGEAYVMEAIVEGTDEKAEINYTGVTGRGRIYSSKEAPQESGAYVAHASIKGNSNYRGDIAARGFTISKSTSDVEITSDANKKYDGKAYEASSIVKDKKGNVVEGANVKYTYYKGLFKLSSAPKKVGSYKVVANYSGDNAHYGSRTSFEFNITK
ncbi:MAG: MBG domain-containing protein, partial [Paraclostridium sp.]